MTTCGQRFVSPLLSCIDNHSIWFRQYLCNVAICARQVKVTVPRTRTVGFDPRSFSVDLPLALNSLHGKWRRYHWHLDSLLSVCGFIVCFLHFMHICHARHYSTLRNVHYRKRRRSSRPGWKLKCRPYLAYTYSYHASAQPTWFYYKISVKYRFCKVK